MFVGRSQSTSKTLEMKPSKIKYDNQEVEEEKDLGVWVTKDMKPAMQCEKAARSANMALGMIRRSFHYRNKETLVPLYKTFVRPRMEFAVAAWAPWTEKDAAVLEAVQKRALRMISDIQGDNYENRLAETGLTTLSERRRRGDMIEVFKTMRGFNRVEREEWFDIMHDGEDRPTRPTRSNTAVTDNNENRRADILRKPSANGEMRNNFFSIRVVRKWNELPDSIKTQKSTNAFKSAYDTWNKNQ